jgi:hypothetical protein
MHPSDRLESTNLCGIITTWNKTPRCGVVYGPVLVNGVQAGTPAARAVGLAGTGCYLICKQRSCLTSEPADIALGGA